MRSNFVSVGMNVLNLAVVGPLVADVEGGGDGAAVGVVPVRAEQVLVQVLVQVAHRVVERQDDDLDWFLHVFEF
jgi:hypothetical protein